MNFLHTLTGSFAQPAAENPTVAMIEAAYRHHGMEWRYVNCEVPPEKLGAVNASIAANVGEALWKDTQAAVAAARK